MGDLRKEMQQTNSNPDSPEPHGCGPSTLLTSISSRFLLPYEISALCEIESQGVCLAPYCSAGLGIMGTDGGGAKSLDFGATRPEFRPQLCHLLTDDVGQVRRPPWGRFLIPETQTILVTPS